MQQYSPQDRTNSNVAGSPQVGRGFGSAFTIIELLIVIVIIGILVAIVAVSYNGITKSAKETSTVATAAQAGKKIVTGSMTKADGLPADKAGALAMAEMTESNGKTFQYTKNTAASPNNFCLTVTEGDISAHITGDATGTVNQAIEGPCNDHQGEAPDLSRLNCPTGFIPVPGNSYFNQPSFCVMKYEAKIKGNDNGQTAYADTMVSESRATGTPWVNISQVRAIEASKRLGDEYSLISDNQWLTIAHNALNQPSNWSGNEVGSGYILSGHNDGAPNNMIVASANDTDGYSGTGNAAPSNQRRTTKLSNGETIWDLSGNVWEWTTQTTQGAGDQPGVANAGYGWQEWNQNGVVPGMFATSFPAYAAQRGASWNGATHNIGRLYSSNAHAEGRALFRGGGWDYGSYSGTFAAIFSYAPASGPAHVGFRAAYTP